jgi:hypothetical protein
VMVDDDVKEHDVGWAVCMAEAWGPVWDALGWFGSECRRFRSVSKWFEVVE